MLLIVPEIRKECLEIIEHKRQGLGVSDFFYNEYRQEGMNKPSVIEFKE
jgi:hypothetical protein